MFVIWVELCLRPMRFKVTGINTQKVNDFEFIPFKRYWYVLKFVQNCVYVTCITQCGFCLNKCIVIFIVLFISNIAHIYVVLRSVS